MKRTPLPQHPLTRDPLNFVLTGLSMGLFLTVVVNLGFVALGVTFALWSAGLVFYGFRFGRRQLRRIEEDRARCVRAHNASMADRMMFAQRQSGWEFEAESPETAVGFGRIRQQIPDRGLIKPERCVTHHAAELVAEGVLRSRIDGYPVTVFDLEMINHDDVEEVKKRCGYSRAAEATKDYLTVCVVELPLHLPYVTSAYLFGPSWREIPRTADPEFAEFLLSRPGVREVALDETRLWSVQQNRLIACALTNAGLDTPEAVGLATRTVSLAGAFPWSELERFRLPEPTAGERPAYTMWASNWWERPYDAGLLGPWALLWDEARVGRTDLRAYFAEGEILNLDAVENHTA